MASKIKIFKLIPTLLFLIAPVALANGSLAQFGNTMRLVFQFQSKDSAMQTLGPSAVAMNFDLTNAGQQSLYHLSEGDVDFRNIYLIDVKNNQTFQSISRLPGFQGPIYPNVPPPVVISSKPDPELEGQWWIEKLRVEKAWDLATGKGVTVADCDAGWRTGESDLIPNLKMEDRYDLSDKKNPFKVDDGSYVYHGTAVAAIMSAALDEKGTNGISFDAKIVPLQNFNYSSHLDSLDKEEATARCILRAITIQDVRIIVLENQTATGSSETFIGTRNAVRLALKSGITVVSAAGNYSVELTAEELDNTESIIVGALLADGTKAGFSNFGKRVSIAAYGEELYTLFGPDGAMGEFGGTSGATPQVAATVALMLEANPRLTPNQVRKILEQTRITEPGNNMVGGRLDVFAAVLAAKDAKPEPNDLQKMHRFRKQVITILQKNKES